MGLPQFIHISQQETSEQLQPSDKGTQGIEFNELIVVKKTNKQQKMNPEP